MWKCITQLIPNISNNQNSKSDSLNRKVEELHDFFIKLGAIKVQILLQYNYLLLHQSNKILQKTL